MMIRFFHGYRNLILVTIVIPFIIGISIFSQENTRQQVFRVTDNPNFSQPIIVLKQLVAHLAKTRQNTFCVIGYRYDGTEQAWVYWREGEAIILWEPNLDGIANLVNSKRYFHLPQDVVADETLVGGSTYLVTKQWVDSLINDCHKQGEYFKVLKK